MRNKLTHWYRLLTERSGKGRLIGYGDHKWRVEYDDGGRSVPMHYDVACDYAEIFGGKVVRRE